MGRKSIEMLAVVAAALSWGDTAFAHAMLEKASPRVGSVVEIPPVQITLSFSERIEVGLSSIVITDANGAPIDTGPLKRGGDATTIVVAVPGSLPAGRYTVAWSVLSVDGHPTKGDFYFVVSR